MRLLFIDISNNTEVKILNTFVKKNLKILSAYQILNQEEKDPFEIIQRKLIGEKLDKIPAIIIPPRDMVNYHTFYFPVIPDKEIKKVLVREIGKIMDSTEEIIFDFQVGETITNQNEKKIEVISYYITKSKSWGMLEKFKKMKLQVLKIIPEVQSLEVFIKNNFFKDETKTSNGIVAIDMMAKKINMNIFNKNIWSLNREFPFKVDENTVISDNDFSRISTEFSRTFQYFKQKNKNVSIEHAIIYGSNPETVILNKFVNEHQPIGATLASKIVTNCKTVFPQHLEDKDEFVSLFFIAIATANSFIKKTYIDLYPKAFIEKENFPKQILYIGLMGLIVLIGLIISTSLYLRQKSDYKDNLKNITNEFNRMQTQIDLITEIRKKRRNYYEKIILMEAPRRISYQVSDFVRQFSLLLDAEVLIKISKFIITPKDDNLDFILVGELFYDNINGALTAFDVLLKKVKKISGVSIKNFTAPSSIAVKKKQDLSWTFTIHGQVELILEPSK